MVLTSLKATGSQKVGDSNPHRGVITAFPKLTGTNSPELGPTDVAADSVQGSERRRYNVTIPDIGIYVDFILFASAICVSKRLGSD